MSRRALHRLLALLSMLALALLYVPAGCLIPPLGDWLAGRMRTHSEEANR